MRKIYLFVVLCSVCFGAVAQDVTTTTTTSSSTEGLRSKKGEAYLPEMDEWGLGVSAAPFLQYFGNFLNGATGTNGAPGFNFAQNHTSTVPAIAIFGKLVKDENTAYRVRFNIGKNTSIIKSVISQDELTPDPDFPAFTEDWRKTNTTAIVISPGIEKRRGSTRLQGVYGGELVFGLTSTKTTYEYGNPMTADFTSPTSTNAFGGNLLGPGGTSSIRLLEDKSGSNFLVGARGFIGVEYFFAPKISLGGEFGYMFAYQTRARSLQTTQTWDPSTTAIRETKTDLYRNNGLTSIGIGLDNLSGSINLLFYF
jgi:hypothetical protein